jgi:hypothetical protein
MSLLLFTGVSNIAGCRLRHDAHNAPGKFGDGVSSECNNGYAVADGPYRYENNQWGSDSRKAPSNSAC